MATAVVTGADGFIGSHLVERLVQEGVNVRATCLYNSWGTFGWLDDLPRTVRLNVDVRMGDIRDVEWVDGVVRGADLVLHLAALVAIPHSYAAPRSFYDTNVAGTLNVFEAARRHNVQRVVHTSTSEVYGTPTAIPIVETHALNAQSPYAASKVAADQLALAYHRSFDLPVTILRPFNTYGPRQSQRAVLPSILVQLLAGHSEIHLGRLDTKRDMTFVADTVDGFVRAATTKGIEGEVIQLGTNSTYSVGEMFEIACRVTGKTAKVKVDERRMRPAASEVLTLQSSPAKAQSALQWSPLTSFQDGIKLTADWLAANIAKYKAADLLE